MINNGQIIPYDQEKGKKMALNREQLNVFLDY